MWIGMHRGRSQFDEIVGGNRGLCDVQRTALNKFKNDPRENVMRIPRPGSEVEQPFWVLQRWCEVEVPPLYPHTPAMCAQPVAETPWGGSVQGQRGCSALEPLTCTTCVSGGASAAHSPVPHAQGSAVRSVTACAGLGSALTQLSPPPTLEHSVQPPASLALAAKRFKHSSNPQLLAKYILPVVGLELPPSQRSPRQGREAELSPLQGAQKRPCSGGASVKVQGSSTVQVHN
jgi:hypothetical protein